MAYLYVFEKNPTCKSYKVLNYFLLGGKLALVQGRSVQKVEAVQETKIDFWVKNKSGFPVFPCVGEKGGLSRDGVRS